MGACDTYAVRRSQPIPSVLSLGAPILAACGVVLGVLLGALLLPAQVVWAHADLQQAEPAVGAAVPAPPTAMRLRFTEPLDRSATRIEVYDERGTRVDRGDLQIGPPNDRLATVELGDLGEGVYTVRWWSHSQVDGHRWQGVYRFGIGRTPPPAEGTVAPLPSLAELLVQWTALVATSLVVGMLAFRAWALEPVIAPHPPAPSPPRGEGEHGAAGEGGNEAAIEGEAKPSPSMGEGLGRGETTAVARLARALRWSLGLLVLASVGEAAGVAIVSGVANTWVL